MSPAQQEQPPHQETDSNTIHPESQTPPTMKPRVHSTNDTNSGHSRPTTGSHHCQHMTRSCQDQLCKQAKIQQQSVGTIIQEAEEGRHCSQTPTWQLHKVHSLTNTLPMLTTHTEVSACATGTTSNLVDKGFYLTSTYTSKHYQIMTKRYVHHISMSPLCHY
jgi:hypothetical protein